ncbi:DNA-binding response regulator, partial [bacterium M00.F.Ca.ET.177.01.1.1]
ELDATDYILKPFEQKRIAQAIHKVETALDHDTYKQANDVSQHQNDAHKENTPTSQMVLPIEVDERIHIINLEDIIAISVNNGITTINTLQENYHTTEPLNHYE